MGAGKSSLHFNGAFGATRIWCQRAKNSRNCEGVDICLWEGNCLERYLVSIFAGADSAWNDGIAQQPEQSDPYRERLTGQIFSRMLSWQTLFAEANETAATRDRGPAVFQGDYVSGPRAGRPIAPTAILRNG